MSGVREEGILNAANKELALSKLRQKNSIIISLVEASKKHTWFWQKPHMKLQEKVIFTTQLATMIRVGIPLTEALNIILTQTKRPQNKEMFRVMIEMIHSGQTLAKSLRIYDCVFPELFINMVASGEESGNLEQVLFYLSEQLEKEYEMRKKIISAFIYPAVIISITLLLSIGIVVFIMPKILKIFSSFDFTLPLPTRILIGLSTFLTEKPHIALLFVILFVMTVRFSLKARFLKPFWHTISLYIPIFSKIFIEAQLARISRLLFSLLQAGIPITKTLLIIANTLNHSQYKEALMNSQEKVIQGGKLGESFSDYEKLFPAMWTKMLAIGEKTGSLETTCGRLADMYEKNVDSMTKNLSVLLEPILLVFMGLLVGGVALAIIMPIYQLPNLIGQ